MEPSADIAAVLAEVGPRLKRLRTHRGVTLTDLAAITGISKSTLSRLETGQRKPSLELLLPIAKAHRVPLDELVGATEIGDPRIRPRARKTQRSHRHPAQREQHRRQRLEGLDPSREGRARAPYPRRLRMAVRLERTECG